MLAAVILSVLSAGLLMPPAGHPTPVPATAGARDDEAEELAER